MSDITFAAVGFSALVVVVMALRYYTTRNLLDPLILFSGALLWYFGLHVVWLDAQTGNPMSIPRPFEAGLTGALGWLAVAYVLLVGAFLLIDPRPRRTWKPRREITPAAIIAAYAVGITAGVYGLGIGAFSKAGQLGGGNVLTVRFVFGLALFAFVLAAVEHYRGAPNRWLMPLMGLGLAAFAMLGTKVILFEVLFAWLLVRSYMSGKRLTLIGAAAAVAAFMFVITPIIQSSRETAQNRVSSASEEASLAVSTLPSRMLTVLGDPQQMTAGLDIVNYRTQGTESLALSILYTQTYKQGASWWGAPAVLIPAEIWPGKPVPYLDAREFSLRYAGQRDDGYTGLAISPTIPGDLWVNFGWPALLGGFLLLGILLRYIGNAAQRMDPTVGMPVMVLLMLDLILVEVSVGALLANLILASLTVVIGTWLVREASYRLRARSIRGDTAVMWACVAAIAATLYVV